MIFVVFIATQKKRQKCDKSDKMSLFQFVGGHPRIELQKIGKIDNKIYVAEVVLKRNSKINSD